jgi:glycosyltransferase involved in cell wall biosynthesis
VRFLGPVWDQVLLDQLYANSASYLHGHSVGGTNPSLLRAIGAGTPVITFDVNFNREVTGGGAFFFADSAQVGACIQSVETDDGARQRADLALKEARARYDWEDVARTYLALAVAMARD